MAEDASFLVPNAKYDVYFADGIFKDLQFRGSNEHEYYFVDNFNSQVIVSRYTIYTCIPSIEREREKNGE